MVFILLLIQYGLFFALAALIFLWCRYQWQNWEALMAARSLPTGLPTLPLLGHLHHFIFNWEGIFLKFVSALTAKVSGTYCMWIGPLPIIFIQQPKDIQLVLNSSKMLDKSWDYDVARFGGGNGLITAPAHIWKISRRHLNPMFRPQNLNHIILNFHETSRQLVHRMSSYTNGNTFNVFDMTYDLAIINTSSLVFGSDIEIDTTADSFILLRDVVRNVGALLAKRFLNPMLRLDTVFQFCYYKDLRKLEKTWENLPPAMYKVIQERISRRNVSKFQNRTDSQTMSNNQDNNRDQIILPDVYDFLIQNYSQFKDEDVRFEGQTIFLAGSDTNSVALSSCLVALGSHQDIQERVYNEIMDVIGDKVDDMTAEDANRLLYTEQVLKETLRRFTVIPFILRRTNAEIKLHDCTLPKGLSVCINIAGLSMNPTIFPDPEKFDPDRFCPENVAKRERYSFLAFSGGARDCIGKHYAMLVMKVTLAHILRNFKVFTDTDINKMQFQFEGFMISAEGYNIKLTKRV